MSKGHLYTEADINYTESDVVYVNPKKKPEPGEFVENKFRSFHTNEETEEYVKAFTRWKKQSIKVKNARKIKCPGTSAWTIAYNETESEWFQYGQLCEHKNGFVTELFENS